MANHDIAAALRAVRFLGDVAEDHLEQLARVSRLKDYPAGATIFREGDPAESIYLLMDGKVALEICAPGVGCRRICTLSEGELLAWSPLLQLARLTATARAITPIRLVELNAHQVLALCEHDPRFGFEFMRRAALALAKRLSAARLQLVNVYGEQLPGTAMGSMSKPDGVNS